MSLKAMSHHVSFPYAIADKFGSLSNSHREAANQIKQEQLGLRPNYRVLDFGVGNGFFLQKLQQEMPEASFTGIDVSKEMLHFARQAVAFTPIEADMAQASTLLPNHSQDLVLAHFINAPIPIETLIEEANLLTRANGYFSLITTTCESFPEAQTLLANFIAKGTLIGSLVGHYYKNMMQNSAIAPCFSALSSSLQEHQFTIVQHKRLCIPIQIEDMDALLQFGIEGTWFFNTVSTKMLPKHFLIQRLKRIFRDIFTFPYKDTHTIDVILAKK